MLQNLDHDALVCVLSEVKQTSLSRLSQTCRMLREACMPFMFRKIRRPVAGTFPDPEWFFPPTLPRSSDTL
ncbi:hypothetical protein V8D89_002255 [Ganoderma adspersum]